MDDLPFSAPLTPANPAAPASRKCRRHLWGQAYTETVYQADEGGYVVVPDGRSIAVGLGHSLTVASPDPSRMACSRCGKVADPTASRRGRTNRNRGNAIEREVGHRLGLKRVGQFGGATDLGESHDPFAVSVKSGSGYFSERYWDQLKRQPVAAGQTALLVVTDAPGPGHVRRAMVVLDIADWIALHGLSGVTDVP